jgi:1,2-phenylacetyl-CoA epoxidase catalytic subunit
VQLKEELGLSWSDIERRLHKELGDKRSSNAIRKRYHKKIKPKLKLSTLHQPADTVKSTAHCTLLTSYL